MSELKKMELEIHHEKHEAEHQQRREERELRKEVARESMEMKTLSNN